MGTPVVPTSKRARSQLSPASPSSGDALQEAAAFGVIPMSFFDKIDCDIRGHEYSLDNTMPVKEPKARTLAINDALAFMKTTHAKVSRAYIDLAARYQELAALRNQFVSVISSGVSNNVLGDLPSVTQQIGESIASEWQRAMNANAVQNDVFEERVGRKVAESVASALGVLGKNFVANPPTVSKSYASVTRKDDALASQSVFISKSRALAVTGLKEFVVEPLPECKAKFADSKAVKDAILSKIDAKKFNIRARGVFESRNLAVRVVAETVDLVELRSSCDLKDAGLMIRDRPLLQPRLLVRNVPEYVKSDAIASEICARNLVGANPNSIKIIFAYPQMRNRSDGNVVIEVTPLTRIQLMEKGRIYLGYGRVAWRTTYA